MNYLRHPAWLWMEKHAKEKLPPHDAATQAIFETGYKFETVAEKLFPEALRLGWENYEQYTELAKITQAIIANENGSRTIIQAKFDTNELTCICDVVFVDGVNVDLYEIKSSTSVKKEHIFDLAFQSEVLRRNGYTVRSVTVLTVNSGYVRKGSIAPEELVDRTDVTSRVYELEALTNIYINDALTVMHNNEQCSTSPTLLGPIGTMSEWVKILRYSENIPEFSIYDLVRIDKKRYKSLANDNIHLLREVPSNYDLTPAQELQVLATKQNTPIINYDAIRAFVCELEYPLYFLDYETYSGVIPFFDGQRPYQQIPFQYSLHILDSPNSTARHQEYLQTECRDDTQALSNPLREAIGEHGSIITWNMGFEKTCNKTMGILAPEFADFYAAVNERITDISIPFKDLMYIDKRFKGSYSIKKVLPVLVPELKYDDLIVRDGNSAQALWMGAVLEENKSSLKEKERLFVELKKYCALDTFAMVAIYQKLIQLESKYMEQI